MENSMNTKSIFHLNQEAKEAAAQVKRQWNESNHTVQEISILLNVPVEYVSDVVNGRIYRNVPPAPF